MLSTVEHENSFITLGFQRAKHQALIRLYGCAGWSAPLLLAYNQGFLHLGPFIRHSFLYELYRRCGPY